MKPRIFGATRHAFSLVELLTVIFIITLLIGILVPSIGAARRSAKNATTKKTIQVITTGLELFRNDHEKDFRQTNGYPPSFEHPPIPGYSAFDRNKRREGGFPFLAQDEFPSVTGAHWLPAMLMGVDGQGFIPKSNVPRADNIREQPWRWYNAELLDEQIPRSTLYLDPTGTPVKATETLPGQFNPAVFPDYDQARKLPVIVDAFEYPILYYVANPNGKTTNMLEDQRDENNNYDGGDQQNGTPYYFHEDNAAFTGTSIDDPNGFGWNLSGRIRPHPIAQSGANLTAPQIYQQFQDEDRERRQTFARYIMDRSLWTKLRNEGAAVSPKTPLRPVNAESFLLISAGADGLYGTNDDVSNLPDFPSD